MNRSDVTPESIIAIEHIIEMLAECYETKKTLKADLQLGGQDMGDSIVITMKYKGNKNANKSIN